MENNFCHPSFDDPQQSITIVDCFLEALLQLNAIAYVVTDDFMFPQGCHLTGNNKIIGQRGSIRDTRCSGPETCAHKVSSFVLRSALDDLFGHDAFYPDTNWCNEGSAPRCPVCGLPAAPNMKFIDECDSDVSSLLQDTSNIVAVLVIGEITPFQRLLKSDQFSQTPLMVIGPNAYEQYELVRRPLEFTEPFFIISENNETRIACNVPPEEDDSSSDPGAATPSSETVTPDSVIIDIHSEDIPISSHEIVDTAEENRGSSQELDLRWGVIDTDYAAYIDKQIADDGLYDELQREQEAMSFSAAEKAQEEGGTKPPDPPAEVPGFIFDSSLNDSLNAIAQLMGAKPFDQASDDIVQKIQQTDYLSTMSHLMPMEYMAQLDTMEEREATNSELVLVTSKRLCPPDSLALEARLFDPDQVSSLGGLPETERLSRLLNGDIGVQGEVACVLMTRRQLDRITYYSEMRRLSPDSGELLSLRLHMDSSNVAALMSQSIVTPSRPFEETDLDPVWRREIGGLFVTNVYELITDIASLLAAFGVSASSLAAIISTVDPENDAEASLSTEIALALNEMLPVEGLQQNACVAAQLARFARDARSRLGVLVPGTLASLASLCDAMEGLAHSKDPGCVLRELARVSSLCSIQLTDNPQRTRQSLVRIRLPVVSDSLNGLVETLHFLPRVRELFRNLDSISWAIRASVQNEQWPTTERCCRPSLYRPPLGHWASCFVGYIRDTPETGVDFFRHLAWPRLGSKVTASTCDGVTTVITRHFAFSRVAAIQDLQTYQAPAEMNIFFLPTGIQFSWLQSTQLGPEGPLTESATAAEVEPDSLWTDTMSAGLVLEAEIVGILSSLLCTKVQAQVIQTPLNPIIATPAFCRLSVRWPPSYFDRPQISIRGVAPMTFSLDRARNDPSTHLGAMSASEAIAIYSCFSILYSRMMPGLLEEQPLPADSRLRAWAEDNSLIAVDRDFPIDSFMSCIDQLNQIFSEQLGSPLPENNNWDTGHLCPVMEEYPPLGIPYIKGPSMVLPSPSLAMYYWLEGMRGQYPLGAFIDATPHRQQTRHVYTERMCSLASLNQVFTQQYKDYCGHSMPTTDFPSSFYENVIYQRLPSLPITPTLLYMILTAHVAHIRSNELRISAVVSGTAPHHQGKPHARVHAFYQRDIRGNIERELAAQHSVSSEHLTWADSLTSISASPAVFGHVAGINTPTPAERVMDHVVGNQAAFDCQSAIMDQEEESQGDNPINLQPMTMVNDRQMWQQTWIIHHDFLKWRQQQVFERAIALITQRHHEEGFPRYTPLIISSVLSSFEYAWTETAVKLMHELTWSMLAADLWDTSQDITPPITPEYTGAPLFTGLCDAIFFESHEVKRKGIPARKKRLHRERVYWKALASRAPNAQIQETN